MQAQENQVSRRDRAQIEAWMRRQVAHMLDVTVSEIQPDVPLMSYGLDSAAAIALTEMLSEWLGRELDPTLVFEHPSIVALASALERTES